MIICQLSVIDYPDNTCIFAPKTRNRICMQETYEEMMQEVDKRVSGIDLNGSISLDCKTIIVFLKEKLSELKVLVESMPFSDETEEISYFKYQKTMLLGRLIIFSQDTQCGKPASAGRNFLDKIRGKVEQADAAG